MAKDYVCDLILISQQEYVCVCVYVSVSAHAPELN